MVYAMLTADRGAVKTGSLSGFDQRIGEWLTIVSRARVNAANVSRRRSGPKRIAGTEHDSSVAGRLGEREGNSNAGDAHGVLALVTRPATLTNLGQARPELAAIGDRRLGHRLEAGREVVVELVIGQAGE